MENLTNIRIRKVNSRDVGDIVKLHRKVVSVTNAEYYNHVVIKEWLVQITLESVKDQLKMKSTSWYLLELDGKIIGFCQFSIAKRLIYQLNIDPEYQGKGYGKILHNFIEKKFKENHMEIIELNSTINARPFYERMGFKVVKSIRFKVIKTEMDMFEMQKLLR